MGALAERHPLQPRVSRFAPVGDPEEKAPTEDISGSAGWIAMKPVNFRTTRSGTSLRVLDNQACIPYDDFSLGNGTPSRH